MATKMGNITQEVEEKTEDEIGQLSESFQELMNWMKEMAEIAANIAEGNLDQKIKPKSDNDTFGKAFYSMIGNLKDIVK